MPLNFSQPQQVAEGRDEARRGRRRDGLRDRPGGPERHAGRGGRGPIAAAAGWTRRLRRSRRPRSRRRQRGQLQMEKPDEGLPKIAAATGGGYFELTSPRDLASTFARVADELHHQYALGFTPEKLDGKMHDLTVHLSNPTCARAPASATWRSKAPGTPVRPATRNAGMPSKRHALALDSGGGGLLPADRRRGAGQRRALARGPLLFRAQSCRNATRTFITRPRRTGSSARSPNWTRRSHRCPSHQIIVRLDQIAATVGDGHTGVHLPSSFTMYPIRLFWFGTELRVTAAAAEYPAALGARVVKINGFAIDDVQARVPSCFPSAEQRERVVRDEHEPRVHRPPRGAADAGHRAGPRTRAVHARGRRGPSDDDRDCAGRGPPAPRSAAWSTSACSSAAKAQALYLQKQAEPFWFMYLAESKIVYAGFRRYPRSSAITPRRCSPSSTPIRTPKLVIDMRQNGGGDFFVGRKHLIAPIHTTAGAQPEGEALRHHRPADILGGAGQRRRSSATRRMRPWSASRSASGPTAIRRTTR